MRCPQCKRNYDQVLNTRERQAGTITRRFRRCKACRHRWTTLELDEARLTPKTPQTRRDTPSNP